MNLTPVEQRAYDSMESGIWYDGVGLYGQALSYRIRRREHVLECLRTKGRVESKVEFSTPGNPYSTYRLYRKIERRKPSPQSSESTKGKTRRSSKSPKSVAMALPSPEPVDNSPEAP
jgi:hypothetical protein